MRADSPFAGEGYRKLRARRRRQHGGHVSGKRVLGLLRAPGLLAPQAGSWPAQAATSTLGGFYTTLRHPHRLTIEE